jgi:hypothetical protein
MILSTWPALSPVRSPGNRGASRNASTAFYPPTVVTDGLHADHEAPERAVEEQQVDPVPCIADAEPPLTSDEREVAAELEEEVLEAEDERFLELRLGVLRCKAPRGNGR